MLTPPEKAAVELITAKRKYQREMGQERVLVNAWDLDLLLAALSRFTSPEWEGRLLADQSRRIGELEGALVDEKMEHGILKDLLSRPEVDEFWDGLVLEAAHQRQRWGDAHDRSKSAENWFWLVGYLSGKALRSAIQGDDAKARHHTISSAAALFQWWKAIKSSPQGVGADTDLDPDRTALKAEEGNG